MTFIPTTSPSRTAKWSKGSGGPAGDECQNLIAHSLTANGFDASEDGTGRGTPIVPVTVFNHQAGGSKAMMRFSNRHTTALGTTQTPAVAFHENQRHELTVSETAGSLKVGGGKPGQGYPAVCFQERGRPGGRELEIGGDVAYALTAPKDGGRSQERNIATQTAVRRLTPRECERLMGWPDDWTRWDDEGKELKDGPRYRLCGNGVVANVAEWIGRRLIENA